MWSFVFSSFPCIYKYFLAAFHVFSQLLLILRLAFSILSPLFCAGDNTEDQRLSIKVKKGGHGRKRGSEFSIASCETKCVRCRLCHATAVTGKALHRQPVGKPSLVKLFSRDPLEQVSRPAPLKNSCLCLAHYSSVLLGIAGTVKKLSFLGPFHLVSPLRVSINLFLQAPMPSSIA